MSLQATRRNIPEKVTESDFSVFLWGGEEKFNRRRDVLLELVNNAVFAKGLVSNYSSARKDSWIRATYQARELISIKLRKNWSPRHFIEAIRLTDWFLPVQPQFRIFISNLERQMSDEQKKIWIPKAERFEIFGSYSQTELGHGSNVAGIETTATFDSITDEFILNSPTISSTKYWIGSTGIWATHTIVVARLIINGKEYGNHLFLIQLRDLSTHKIMPGVEVYEIGPKAFQGMLGVDNGAIQFHNVRIPRTQMLARNAQVERDGTYVKPKNLKHSYGSMVTVRALMTEITGQDLMRAVSVAYHYTTFRKQFKRNRATDTEETRVYDYASVRHRILPLLAQAIVLILVGQKTKHAYDMYTNNMLKGDTSQLEDLHLQTAGAKVYATEITAHGIETCRLSCGGHGYHALAGFSRMYAHSINGVTYEGENYVLAQQVPRALLKHFKSGTESSLPSISYLSLLRSRTSRSQPENLDNPKTWTMYACQEWALQQRLLSMIRQHIADDANGLDTSYTTHALTMAHCDYVYWKGIWEVIDLIRDQPFSEPMRVLAQVFSLSVLQDPHHPSHSQHLPLPASQREALRNAYNYAIADLGDNHADAIIQAYGLTEYEMDSALARSKQTPYEALFEAAKNSEMSGENTKELWSTFVENRNLWKKLGNADMDRSSMAKL